MGEVVVDENYEGYPKLYLNQLKPLITENELRSYLGEKNIQSVTIRPPADDALDTLLGASATISFDTYEAAVKARLYSYIRTIPTNVFKPIIDFPLGFDELTADRMVYATSFPDRMTRTELKNYFERAGNVTSMKIIRENFHPYLNLRSVLVNYHTREEADQAIYEFHMSKMDGYLNIPLLVTHNPLNWMTIIPPSTVHLGSFVAFVPSTSSSVSVFPPSNSVWRPQPN